MDRYVEENISYFLLKNKKSENHIFNKIREKVIEIFLIHYNDSQFILSGESKILFENFKSALEKNGIVKIIEVKSIGGRNNTDFNITYEDRKGNRKNIDLEFKSGTLRMETLPQFLQLYTTNKNISLLDSNYHQFYYDHYLDKVLTLLETKHIELKKPKYEEYLRDLNNTNKKDIFHYKLYQAYKKYRVEVNSIVKDSIKDYLEINRDRVNMKSLNEKLGEQMNKIYLLTQGGKFRVEEVSEYMKVNCVKGIRNGNTIVLVVDQSRLLKKSLVVDQSRLLKKSLQYEKNGEYEIHCLLRWKNGNGCRGPAWQISMKSKGSEESSFIENRKVSIWNELDDLEDFVFRSRKSMMKQ
jgi:hypothetical protein